MRIHKEGRSIILIILGLLIIINAIIWLILPFGLSWWYQGFNWSVSVTLVVLIMGFFRVPARNFIPDPNAVFSTADGRVVVIEEVDENEYFNDRRIQVSVFMSVKSVHVNWYPVDGTVSHTKYHKGLFLVAYHPKSSTDNERMITVVKRDDGKEVLIKQIAGVFARRVVCYAKEGTRVKQFDQLGFIKFGSRIDFLLPLDAKVTVQLQEMVKGGITKIAEL